MYWCFKSSGFHFSLDCVYGYLPFTKLHFNKTSPKMKSYVLQGSSQGLQRKSHFLHRKVPTLTFRTVSQKSDVSMSQSDAKKYCREDGNGTSLLAEAWTLKAKVRFISSKPYQEKLSPLIFGFKSLQKQFEISQVNANTLHNDAVSRGSPSLVIFQD